MIKKIISWCFMLLILLTQFIPVSASNAIQAKIGDTYYDTLKEAIANAKSTDTITLTSNVSLTETLEINKTVNIDLNNHNIEAEQQVFSIQGGSLNLTGEGKIIETKPYYGAITLKGSDNSTDTEFSTANIDEGVTLEGWSGIFINHNNQTAYGISINMSGTINAVDDINGDPGAGIYVNGNVQHSENSPVINLNKTAKITSTGNGIYAAGYATYNINGAHIEGEESALGIKAGVFNILDGTIIGTGEDQTPTSGNNNGINASGTAIQIESNSAYKGDIELNIQKGTITSEHSNVIYEYTVNDTDTNVKSINITGGDFTSNAQKDVFSLSDSFTSTHQNFISGGTYSSDPTVFLASGYSVAENDNIYEVVSNTMGVFATKEANSANSTWIILIVSLFVAGIFIYFNRQKLINLIK